MKKFFDILKQGKKDILTINNSKNNTTNIPFGSNTTVNFFSTSSEFSNEEINEIFEDAFSVFDSFNENTFTEGFTTIETHTNGAYSQKDNREINHETEDSINHQRYDDTPKIIAVTCKNCGASNSVEKGKRATCEYCDTVLNT